MKQPESHPEEWKEIPGFPYKVSNLGRVVILKTGRVIRPHADGNGRLRVNLYDESGDGSVMRVGRLVAMMFIPGFKPELRIGYWDNDPSNCAADNIILLTISQVTKHTLRCKSHSRPGFIPTTPPISQDPSRPSLGSGPITPPDPSGPR